MRLIDADEAIINFGFEWDDICPTRDEVVSFLRKQKTIDAVPVVRCSECRFRNTSWYDKRDMLESFCRWDRDESPNDDDYCSYGERRKP